MNTLIYDAQCTLCKSLALKIWEATEHRVELRALTDPVANELLTRFHPKGWGKDFYLIDDAGCHKGMKALNRIRLMIGTKIFAGLVAEYAQVKTRRRRSQMTHAHDGSPVLSRRSVVEGAILGAVLVPLAAVPKAQAAFATADPSY